MCVSIEIAVEHIITAQHELDQAIENILVELDLQHDVIRTETNQKGILRLCRIRNTTIPELRFFPYRKYDGKISDKFVHLWVSNPQSTQSWRKAIMMEYKTAK